MMLCSRISESLRGEIRIYDDHNKGSSVKAIHTLGFTWAQELYSEIAIDELYYLLK